MEALVLSCLPDEIVLLILAFANPIDVLACSQCSKVHRRLTLAESMWRSQSLSCWPQLGAAAAAWATLSAGYSQRSLDARVSKPADGSWRRMFRHRIRSTPGWSVLCPMYDRAVVLAHQRQRAAGQSWIAQLAFLLLEIDDARTKLRLPTGVRAFRADVEYCRVSCATMALLTRRDASPEPELLAFGERTARALDDWYDLAESGDLGSQQHPLLLSAFRALSAVLVLCDALEAFLRMRDAVAECKGVDCSGSVRETLESVRLQLETSVRSLKEEGCDLSVSPNHRPGLVATRGGHWWWRCTEPRYVSGGCPLIGGE